MNREIKFKAKRKDNNEWVYGYYVRLYNTQNKKVSHRIYTGYSEYCCDEFIEIYENDKLYDEPNDWHYTVGFQDGIFCLLLDEEIVWDDVYEYKNQCEVIGNKFDEELK